MGGDQRSDGESNPYVGAYIYAELGVFTIRDAIKRAGERSPAISKGKGLIQSLSKAIKKKQSAQDSKGIQEPRRCQAKGRAIT